MAKHPSQELKGFGQGDAKLARWAERVYSPSDPALGEIAARSDAHGLPTIAVGVFDGLHLEVLARAIGARKVVEIGTLGGYSGVCLLRGMVPEGVLHTFEFSEAHAQVARESFLRNGFAGRAHVHVGPALQRLPEIEREGPFDLVFIDADKQGYPAYLAWAGQHLRLGGVVLADNAFGWGGVAEEGGTEATRALRAFSEQLASGGRFRATMLPTAEGLAMGVKVR